MNSVDSNNFDIISKTINKINKGFYYGFTILTKETFSDNSCRDVLIKILNEGEEYRNIIYCEKENKHGYILLRSYIQCDDEHNLDLLVHTMMQWKDLCDMYKPTLEKIIKRFMTNHVNKIEIKVYYI